MNTTITNITAEEIRDSRNNPTLQVSVHIGDIVGTFQVPSGASTGTYEACELRDDTTGKGGMTHSLEKIRSSIAPLLIGRDAHDQVGIDTALIALDGTEQKTNLGGNSMIGVSVACAKAAARTQGMAVYEYLRTCATMSPSHENMNPWLYFNLINGGKHAASKLAFQEYHIIPQADTIAENVALSKEIQSKLDELIIKKYGTLPSKGDEGGIALSVDDVTEPLSLLKEVVDTLGYTEKVKFALDVAASSFYDGEKKKYVFMGKEWSREDMINLYVTISTNFPILSIEDPFDEEDYEGFSILQERLPHVKIIGDDLTVTNTKRLQKAIDMKSITGIIIKPNQIGTLSETLETMKLARTHGIDCIISHRSGETMDDFIGDLAYAFGCFGIKAGALGPKERNVKYDRLISITS